MNFIWFNPSFSYSLVMTAFSHSLMHILTLFFFFNFILQVQQKSSTLSISSLIQPWPRLVERTVLGLGCALPLHPLPLGRALLLLLPLLLLMPLFLLLQSPVGMIHRLGLLHHLLLIRDHIVRTRSLDFGPGRVF